LVGVGVLRGSWGMGLWGGFRGRGVVRIRQRGGGKTNRVGKHRWGGRSLGETTRNVTAPSPLFRPPGFPGQGGDVTFRFWGGLKGAG